MFRYVILLICLITTLTASSQNRSFFYSGFNTGMTYSTAIITNSSEDKYDYTNGFTGGLNLGFMIRNIFNIETNVDFNQNGYNTYNRTFLKTGDFTAQKSYFGFDNYVTQEYLKNTWLLGFNFGSRLKLSIQGGGYGALFMNAKSSFTNFLNIDQSEIDQIATPSFEVGYIQKTKQSQLDKAQYSKLDYGLSAGVGLVYEINSIFAMVLRVRYNKGLKNFYMHDPQNSDSGFNRSYNITVGLRYKL